MAEVDEHGHYYRDNGCERPLGRHGHNCITDIEVTMLKQAGWQVTPAPVPECKTCGDTGSFEVDGHEYPCLSCGRGHDRKLGALEELNMIGLGLEADLGREGVRPVEGFQQLSDERTGYKAALEGIRLHHKTHQSRRPSGGLSCGLCRAIWPCKTFHVANEVLDCQHAPRPVVGLGPGGGNQFTYSVCQHCGETLDDRG